MEEKKCDGCGILGVVGLCSSCVGWKDRVSNVCASCGDEYQNTLERYLTCGNYCPLCMRNLKPSDNNSDILRALRVI